MMIQKSFFTKYIQYAILFLVCELSQVKSASYIVGHYHHNKRQNQASAPLLTLDVEPHHSIEPTHGPHVDMPNYYFPVDSGLFNFTCTIKHPSFKFKLIMTKEQVFNNGEKSVPIDLIDPSDYVPHPSMANDKRISVEFSEPTFLDSTARYLRVSFLIRNLKLDDNGIYSCKYSTINKKINTVVYKPVTAQQVSFPVNKVEKLQLNQNTSLTCRVSDVYPRPKVQIIHSKRENIADSVSEKDISSTKHNEYYPFSIASSYNFVPTYADNGADLNCQVSSLGSSNNTITKTLHLNVQGKQIIENECPDTVVAKIGDQDVKISCVFFSNPKLKVNWQTLSDEPKAKQEPTNEQANESETNQLETTSTTVESETNDIITIIGEDDHQNYQVSDHEHGSVSGVYKAVLNIKEVRAIDFKTYTLKLGDIEKTIRLTSNENDIAKGLTSSDSDSSSALSTYLRTNIHSKSYALLFSLINFILILNR